MSAPQGRGFPFDSFGPLPTAADIEPDPPALADYDYVPARNASARLGIGGMGAVYLARWRRPIDEPAGHEGPGDGGLVAVKFLLWGRSFSRHHRKRFQNESNALAHLCHPAVVRCFDIGAAEGRLYYVMEHIEGSRDLFAYQGGREGTQGLDAVPLAAPPLFAEGRCRFVARCLRKLAEGLVHAHAQKVMHRDLKPHNVLVGPMGADGLPVLKIADFGLAAWPESPLGLTGDGEVAGTLLYMAPEQMRGEHDLPWATDVYGLGGVLYFMLTGRPPFGPTEDREGPPQRPRRLVPSVDRDLEAICLKCLEKSPRRRYETAGELIEDLDRYLAGRRPHARPTWPLRWYPPVRRWSRRHGRTAGVVAALAILLLASLVAGGIAAWQGTLAQKNAKTAEDNEEWARREAEEAGKQAALARDNARTADRNAQDARRQAERAEREGRDRLVEGARALVARGQLDEARRLYDTALGLPSTEAEKLAIRGERLRCLFSYGQWGQLDQELDDLAKRTDLPARLWAEVRLHRGDRTLWDKPARAAEGRKDIEAALEAPGGLAPADRAYARGVLAATPLEAIRHFEEALASPEGRFHLRANLALLAELVHTGQFARARQHARFTAAAFPREPATPLLLATAALLEEDQAGHLRHLTELERLVDDPARYARLNSSFRVIDLAVRVQRGANAPPKAGLERFLTDWLGAPPSLWLAVLRGRGVVELFAPGLGSLLNQHRVGEMTAAFRGPGLGLPVSDRTEGLLKDLLRAYVQLSFRPKEADEILERLARGWPEALVRYARVVSQMHLSLRRKAVGDWHGMIAHARQAQALAEEAAQAPTLLPTASYRRSARWLCLLLDGGWRLEHRSLELRQPAAAVGLLAPGPLGPQPLAVVSLVAWGQTMRQALPAPQQDNRHLVGLLAGQTGYDEARSRLLPPLVRVLAVDDARVLLGQWALDEPDEPVPYRLRARLELDAGNFDEACQWAERGLARVPRDRPLRQLREEARRPRLAGPRPPP